MGQICLFSHGLQYHGILRRHLPARTDHKKDTDLPSRFLPSVFTEDNDFNQKVKKNRCKVKKNFDFFVILCSKRPGDLSLAGAVPGHNSKQRGSPAPRLSLE